jgi:hypothetical protein
MRETTMRVGAAALTLMAAVASAPRAAWAVSPLSGLLGPAGLVAGAIASGRQASALEASAAAAAEAEAAKKPGCAPEGMLGEWMGVGRVLLPGETGAGKGFGFIEKLSADGTEINGEVTLTAPPPEAPVLLTIAPNGAKPELPPLGTVELPPVVAAFFGAKYKVKIGGAATVTRTGGASGDGYWNEQEVGFALRSDAGAPQPYAVSLVMQIDDCAHRLVAYEFRDAQDAPLATVHLVAGRPD